MSGTWSTCPACPTLTVRGKLCGPCREDRRSALELAYQRAEMRRRYPVDGLEPPRVVVAPSPGWVPYVDIGTWRMPRGSA
jgi:hypothetical protein